MYHADDQQRYEEFLQHPPEKLDGEMALLRCLIERAQTNPSLCNALIATATKIAGASQAVKLKEGILLERSVVLQLMKTLIEALCGILQEYQLPQYSDIIGRMADSIDGVFQKVFENDKQQPLMLPAPSDNEANGVS